jgi:hypothetical protein
LGGRLTINSKNGRAKGFDEIILTTQGLGNDPYEAVWLRVRKNKGYEYDCSWHENAYFDAYFKPGVVTDRDPTLFPEAKYKLHPGYSGSAETGPALSSQQFSTPGRTRCGCLKMFAATLTNSGGGEKSPWRSST